jgi:acyl-CoA thioesterase I
MHTQGTKPVIAALILLLAALGAPSAWAQAPRVPIPAQCQVPDELLLDSSPLLHTSKQIRSQRRLKVVALGSSSTLGMGATGPEAAYPARLEAVLNQHLPGVAIQVINKGVSRQSAKQMLERLATDVLAEKPTLVIWETGTAEAVRGAELDEFVHALLVGVDKMAEAGIDVVLMDTQYSRSTARIINFQPYVDAIDQVGGMRDLVVFPRYQVMRLWVDEERFTFADKNPAEARKVADQIYDCLARLLARSIGKALK